MVLNRNEMRRKSQFFMENLGYVNSDGEITVRDSEIVTSGNPFEPEIAYEVRKATNAIALGFTDESWKNLARCNGIPGLEVRKNLESEDIFDAMMRGTLDEFF